jgi:ABC-type multidrug transport system ATPase subunit/ABC-type multidrug transport system permease subunit
LIGYVEQFDSLSPHDTGMLTLLACACSLTSSPSFLVREAVEFSAALRLSRDIPLETRQEWVNSVLTMLELLPLENTMVGDTLSGGMSFEQKKRLSIAVELAANPSILFLDEPTTGLDSRAAQVVIRCIRRVAASGRSIVCTIHQPSTYIFNSFDSLLLLKRGGQTVYNGLLGDDNSDLLVNYFEGAPGVTPIHRHQNPATWMLEMIGAGTGGTKESLTDFHVYYNQSSLRQAVESKVAALSTPSDGSSGGNDSPNQGVAAKDTSGTTCVAPYLSISCLTALSSSTEYSYSASYSTQFYWLMKRSSLAYWRSPSYNFVRMMISIVIALIFSSTYANQNYDTDVEVVSRAAVMYITLLFVGVVGMISVQPVVFSERPAFYREQFSSVYAVGLHTLASTLVELPYLLVSSVLFVIPFFFIVGFDQDGVTEKFFYYWLFQGLYMSTLVFIGQFYSTAMPSEASSQVISGMTSTFLTLFCGFMIPSQSIPTFWLFIYWINPLHYALEGLITTQFHQDGTLITLFNGGDQMTAKDYIYTVFEQWSFQHRWGDFGALILFIVLLRSCPSLSSITLYLSLTHPLL